MFMCIDQLWGRITAALEAIESKSSPCANPYPSIPHLCITTTSVRERNDVFSLRSYVDTGDMPTSEQILLSLQDNATNTAFSALLPCGKIDVRDPALIRLGAIMARIIDYKARFTLEHSEQVANKAWQMGLYYGFSDELRTQVYLAAALHDIGKLRIPSDLLDRVGPLAEEEFNLLKSHAMWTHILLAHVPGFEKICEWATNHHERLDGSGYPYGKTGDSLDFVSRLLACLDVYQGTREERPYHPACSHSDAMKALYSMAAEGKLDGTIVQDLDRQMALTPDARFPLPSHADTHETRPFFRVGRAERCS